MSYIIIFYLLYRTLNNEENENLRQIRSSRKQTSKLWSNTRGIALVLNTFVAGIDRGIGSFKNYQRTSDVRKAAADERKAKTKAAVKQRTDIVSEKFGAATHKAGEKAEKVLGVAKVAAGATGNAAKVVGKAVGTAAKEVGKASKVVAKATKKAAVKVGGGIAVAYNAVKTVSSKAYNSTKEKYLEYKEQTSLNREQSRFERAARKMANLEAKAASEAEALIAKQRQLAIDLAEQERIKAEKFEIQEIERIEKCLRLP